ncbi:MAG: tetraacyldisaccharide 4'-kinase [Prevotellaceae bacterium]|jgi:tetraacyldisaccharide 4'-kinase|nr:tetraacyldisaccharide 4'-kinase [Prevotellaceae bacterium]
MKTILLYPLSLIYKFGTAIRNKLFDLNILSAKSFNLPVISVGNLAVGGTGKTPHVELLIDILKNNWKTAVLSRGYKRKTKGFVLAEKAVDSRKIGDESYQIYTKYPEITVAVAEKRVAGIKHILKRREDTQIILLDDAFQHRRVKPGLSILLTDYHHLYTQDRLLPLGRLREPAKNMSRADMIIVTKCPEDVTPIELRTIEMGINVYPYQSIFFSTYAYGEMKAIFEENNSDIQTLDALKQARKPVILVAGIASPSQFLSCLEKYATEITPFFFPDHYQFKPKDYQIIEQNALEQNAPVIVTEKDAARLTCDEKYPKTLRERTFSIGIQVKILQDKNDLFIQKITNYVKENSRNG